MYTLDELADELNRQEWAVERMLKKRGYLKLNGEPRKSTIDDGLMNKNGLIKEAGWSVFIDELGYKESDEDEEDDDVETDNELYNKWQKDPDSYDTREAAKEELQYYVRQKAGYDWDPECEEKPVIVFIREMSELDSDFGDFLQDCYDEICDDQEEFSNFKKDYWKRYYESHDE